MGCGNSDNRSVQSPIPASPKKTVPPAILKADDSKAVWEDERIMFDSDLEREEKCIRSNKWGIAVRPATRDKSRPDDNQAMYALLAKQIAAVGEPALDGRLVLEHMYGYSSLDSRHNLFFTSASRLIYPCASLGILLDFSASIQRYFGGGSLNDAKGHSDQVLALAISPDRALVATGEVGNNPKICVWRAENPEAGPVIEIRQGTNTASVEAICFSANSGQIFVCDGQSSHVVRVFDCGRGTKVFEEVVGNRVLEIAAGEGGIAVAGVRFLGFWWPQGKSFRSERASFGAVGKMCTFAAVRWQGDCCLAGATNGQLYQFQGGVLQRTIQVLPLGASIHALCVSPGYVLVGGNDNIIHELDATFIETRSFPVHSCPRALDCWDNQIVCGTRDGSIVLIRGQEDRLLVESHSDGDVTGLCSNPKQRHLFATTGDDNKIKLWDSEARKCLATGLLDPKVNSHTSASTFSQLPASQQSRAVAVSRLEAIAIAHNDGHISVRKGVSQLNNIQATLADAQDWVPALSFSPDGSRLAVACHDAYLRVYDVKANYRLVAALEGHKGAVVSVDWGANSLVLRSAAEDGEVRYWNGVTGEELDEEDTREEQWATWTCLYGWQTEGVLGLANDPRFFTAVDKHPTLPLLAVANEFGFVQVFKFPCLRGAQCLSYKAHSDRITNVRWSVDGRRLFSTGGYDQSIAQWRWVPSN